MVPLESLDADNLREKVRLVEANGATPIAYSLRRAGEDFSGLEGQKNIVILISDGVESCGGDPCAVARELHESNLDLNIHCVGFQADQKTREMLECIAQASSGTALTASDADQLRVSLLEILRRSGLRGLPGWPVPPGSKKR